MKTEVLSYDELCKSQGFDYNGDSAIESFTKALTATNSGPISVNRTSPLMLENLDGLMTEVLLTEKHFKLFNAITRVPSAGPYFEWNRHSGFGSRRGSIGFGEGGGPQGSVSSFQRNGIYNKYYGVQGGITHQMLTAGMNGGTVEDPQTRENRDRAVELFERMEREVLFGDSALLDESGNNVHWDGLYKLMMAGNSANVIDLQGEALTYTNLDRAARSLVQAGKLISVDGFTGYMSPHVLDGLGEQYKAKNIVRENSGQAKGSTFNAGFDVNGYKTQFGFIDFENSILLEEIEDSVPAAAAPANCPGTVSAPTGSGSSTGNTLVAGTYFYKVGAFNDTGETLPSAASAGIVATAGQKITLTITKPSGNTTGYRIYRSTTADGIFKWVGRVACGGNSTMAWVDTGAWMTVDSDGLEQNGLCVLIKPDPKDLVMSQMLPLVKMPLPQVKTTFPFYLLLYCALVLKAPERVLIYKNCGNYVPA